MRRETSVKRTYGANEAKRILEVNRSLEAKRIPEEKRSHEAGTKTHAKLIFSF